jgi:hypothetical protein
MSAKSWFNALVSLILISLFLHREAAATQLKVYDTYFHKDYVAYTGTIHLYLYNATSKDVQVEDLLWQGKSVGPLFQGEWLKKKLSSEQLVKEQRNYLKKRNNDILWYRVWPNPIPSKEIAEVLLRLAGKPQSEKGILQVKSSAGSIEVPLSFKNPEVRLDYISFSPDLKEIDLFISSEEQNPSDIKEVELNGEKTDFQGSPKFFKGKAYLLIKLNTPLQLGSFPVLHIKTEKDKSFTAMVKAMPGEFRIGAIGGSSRIKSGLYHFFDMMYGCGNNTTLKRLDACIPYNIQSTTSSQNTVYDYDKETSERVFYCHPKHILSMANHPMLWGHFFQDEPDGKHPWQISARIMAWCEEVARRLTPDKHTMITIDHSGWPTDCYAFGEITEYHMVHSFAIHRPRMRSRVMGHCLHAAESSYPQPWWYLPHVPWYQLERPNDARENRMELYYALLKGVKGCTYYPLHKVFQPKVKSNVVISEKDMRKYWAGLGRLNAEVRLVGDLLFRGMLWPLAKTDIDTVDVSSIVSGKRAIVVPVLNNDFDSSLKRPFTYVPAGKVLVKVALPDWFKAEEVFSVSYKGLEKLKYESQKGSLNFTVPDLQLTALIVIAGEKGLYENLQNCYNKEIIPKLNLIDQEEADGVIRDFTQTE